MFGARPARLPLSIGDPTIVTGATAVIEHARAVRLLPPGRPDRRRLPGRGADRPPRQHQHHGHRRLRPPEDAPARIRRRVRDRHQRARGLRDHAPVAALVRGAARLPDLARATAAAPARTGPRRAGWAAARRWSSPTWASTASTTPARWCSTRSTRGDARATARQHGLGAALAPTPSAPPSRPRPRSCASFARSSIRPVFTPAEAADCCRSHR